MLKNIKSKLIIKTLFKNIHNKLKLKIIKNNKYMIRILDINEDDFKIYEILKEFKEKYKLNIYDIDINELNFSFKKIGNEGFKFFTKIKFNELKELGLYFNQISDINSLENANFKNLEILN